MLHLNVLNPTLLDILEFKKKIKIGSGYVYNNYCNTWYLKTSKDVAVESWFGDQSDGNFTISPSAIFGSRPVLGTFLLQQRNKATSIRFGFSSQHSNVTCTLLPTTDIPVTLNDGLDGLRDDYNMLSYICYNLLPVLMLIT